MHEKIELYQIRDFSDKINIVFKFIKQNGKQIAKNLLYLVPVYLVCSILLGAYSGSMYSGIFTGNYIAQYSTQQFYGNFAGFYLIFSFIMIVMSIASYVALLFVVSYVAEYEESEQGIVDSSRAWRRVKKSFWGGFGAGILVLIAITIGFMLCIFPGVWLLISFSLFIPAYIAERNKEQPLTAMDSIGESYTLIKQDWFSAFGFLFVMGLISFAFMFVISFPIQLIQTSVMLIHKNAALIMVINIVGYAIYYIAALFFSAISNVATAVLYYDFKERRDGLSLQKRIESIGQNQN